MYFKLTTPFLVCKKNTKEVYTKYVGGGEGGEGRILKFFKKSFHSPGGHRRKYFMAQ